MTKIQVHLKSGQLLPVSQYDAQRMEDFADGQVFNLTSTGKRSNPHHNLYWAALRNVCKDTGKWPTEKHLHDELKFACGYYSMKYNEMAEEFMRIPNSISFDQMSQQDFMKYFEAAMEKLSDAIGYDPLIKESL
jgi:hypothetical protein